MRKFKNMKEIRIQTYERENERERERGARKRGSERVSKRERGSKRMKGDSENARVSLLHYAHALHCLYTHAHYHS